MRRAFCIAALSTVLAGLFCLSPTPSLAWEPTRPIQFVVPAGTGGGADQMARVIQGIVSRPPTRWP